MMKEQARFIKLETVDLPKEKGFRLRLWWNPKRDVFHKSYKPLLTISFHHWNLFRFKPNWFRDKAFSFQLQFGRGAGYQWGRTFFVGRNVRGGPSEYHHIPAKFRLGFTQNANLVPYSFG